MRRVHDRDVHKLGRGRCMGEWSVCTKSDLYMYVLSYSVSNLAFHRYTHKH